MRILVRIALPLLLVCGLAFAAPLSASAHPAFGVIATAGMDQGVFEQALQASRNGEAEQALPLWDRFLEQHPSDSAALSNRGNVRLVLGDADGAIADQTRAMELSPEEIDPHLNRGTAEEALQQWDAAAADYNWILERDPQEASALYNLGGVAYWMLTGQPLFDGASSVDLIIDHVKTVPDPPSAVAEQPIPPERFLRPAEPPKDATAEDSPPAPEADVQDG